MSPQSSRQVLSQHVQPCWQHLLECQLASLDQLHSLQLCVCCESSMSAIAKLHALRRMPRRASQSSLWWIRTRMLSVLAQAKEILLLAFGENKTSTVAKAVEGPVTPAVPASFLQEHPNASFYLDAAASAGMKLLPICT